MSRRDPGSVTCQVRQQRPPFNPNDCIPKNIGLLCHCVTVCGGIGWLIQVDSIQFNPIDSYGRMYLFNIAGRPPAFNISFRQ